MTLRDRIRCLRAVLRDVDSQLRDGVLPCRCGLEQTLSDLDVRWNIRRGLRADDRTERLAGKRLDDRGSKP
jgi:hypothetical protein